MKKLIDDMITYLNGKFNLQSSLSQKPKGHYAYENGLIPATTPFFTIQALSDTDGREDFNALTSQNIDLQINLYGVKSKISNVITEAQPYSMVIADYCEEFMQYYKYNNDKILSMSKIGRSPTLPYGDGSKAYATAIRYRLEIKLPYIVVNNENNQQGD